MGYRVKAQLLIVTGSKHLQSRLGFKAQLLIAAGSKIQRIEFDRSAKRRMFLKSAKVVLVRDSLKISITRTYAICTVQSNVVRLSL